MVLLEYKDVGVLPHYFLPFIGRRREQRLLRRLLQNPFVRLLTLTGPGGVGKTRLAVEMARLMAADFAGGQFFVDLTPIRDPSLLLPTIAQVVGLAGVEGEMLSKHFGAYLAERGEAILILDNFEQVIGAAPAVEQLLLDAPALKVIVTSREVLRLVAEHEVRVPPLTVPDLSRLPPTADLVSTLSEQEAVVLFLQQAQTVRPGYRPSSEEMVAISTICAHLDGLPLALELAAVRLRLFSPQALLARITAHAGRSLALLSGSQAGRHRSLWQTIAWSYDLLPQEERRLFTRLSIFEGSFTLEAAEEVMGTAGDVWSQTSGGIASLVEKSLLRSETEQAEARFSMLTTIREFAREQLADGEVSLLRRAHAGYYLALAESAVPELTAGGQSELLAALQRAYPNLRSALQWAVDTGEQELALRFGRALSRFWLITAYRGEGQRLLEEVLRNTVTVQDRELRLLRGDALCAAAVLNHRVGEPEKALPQAQEAVETFRSAGDSSGLATALGVWGRVLIGSGDVARAWEVLEEAEKRQRAGGNQRDAARTLHGLGRLALMTGEYERARAAAGEALAIYRAEADAWGEGTELLLLATIAFWEGEYDAAASLLDDTQRALEPLSAPMGRGLVLTAKGLLAATQGKTREAERLIKETQTVSPPGLDLRRHAAVKISLGELALRRGELQTAQSDLKEALESAQRTRDVFSLSMSLDLLAETAVAAGEFHSAAQYLGAEAAARMRVSMPLRPTRRATRAILLAAIQDRLDHPAFERAWRMGPQLHLGAGSRAWQAAPVPQKAEPPLGLTPRQVDVLRLVAQGLTDKEVAAQLVVSPRTVQGHLRNIYDRLGVNSRTAASRIAIEKGLISEPGNQIR